MSSGLRELKLWQEAVALAGDVVRLSRASAKRETKVVTDRLMIASADAATHIAVGYTHPTPAVRLGFYVQARASLVEVETLLAVARQSGVASADPVIAASARAGTVHRLLAGYVAFLERQLGADADGGSRAASREPAAPLTSGLAEA
jgi:four helix bundle protein